MPNQHMTLLWEDIIAILLECGLVRKYLASITIKYAMQVEWI